jgi:hypothetical protein
MADAQKRRGRKYPAIAAIETSGMARSACLPTSRVRGISRRLTAVAKRVHRTIRIIVIQIAITKLMRVCMSSVGAGASIPTRMTEPDNHPKATMPMRQSQTASRAVLWKQDSTTNAAQGTPATRSANPTTLHPHPTVMARSASRPPNTEISCEAPFK